jgi:hypothetical protein
MAAQNPSGGSTRGFHRGELLLGGSDEPVHLAPIPTIGVLERNKLQIRITLSAVVVNWQPEHGKRRKDDPMIMVYELAAIGVAAIAGGSIWHKIHVQRRIRAIDARLEKMQREIEVLQVQESRRLMTTLKGNSKVESPGLDPDDIIDDEVVRLMDKPRAKSVR